MRVLIVEDDTSLAEVVRRGLAAEGIMSDVFHDGISGMWAAVQGDYDVVILDIQLPQLSGYRVLAELRKREVWTPVLMLTAKDGEYDEADAFDLGADDYLTKPFSFVVLIARLRALVRRGKPERPVELTAGDLRLNPTTHHAYRGDTVIDLTPKEFSLLAYLIENAGAVLSKPQILANVWDSSYEGDPNILEVYIGYLRKKIDVPFGRNGIQTVRGLGYRLAEDGGGHVGEPKQGK